MRILLATALLLSLWTSAAFSQSGADARALGAGMERVRAKDWAALPRLSNADARAVIEWHRLRAGQGRLRDYLAFLRDYGDWPGIPLMLKRGEKTISSNARHADVLAYFAAHEAQTALGALHHARALAQTGQRDTAQGVIRNAWLNYPMTTAEMAIYRASWGAVIKGLNTQRLDMLLWRQRFTEAERLFPHVSKAERAAARARIGLVRRVDGVDGLVAAVPASLKNTPGLAYERFVWRARKGFVDSAAELAIAQSNSAKLGRPEDWANRRRQITRRLMREGKNRTAYRLASVHGLSSGAHYADLEWLSGYIALRKLGRPGDALKHFKNHRDATVSPISMGRAGYWIGRAYDAMGMEQEARAAYAMGAEYQTSFYGQLAAEKIGAPTDPGLTGSTRYDGWNSADFTTISVYRAGRLLLAAGELDLAERWFVHLGERLSKAQLGQLSQMAIDLKEPHLALRIAKYAASRGYILHAAYFPMARLSDAKLPVSQRLALSIARRESEFDKKVISPAGARGLMQLMPATARAMARKTGLEYSSSRLLSDAGYNARLGSAYLSQLIEEFGPNIPLISAGYNAGPGRPRQWIKRYGDPRSSQTDVIDWIEHVPFRETRNYIMRVFESVIVYDIRLKGRTVPIRPTPLLKTR